MARTKYTNRDGSLDMRFKVNKQSQAHLEIKQARMKEEALNLANMAIESAKAPVKVEPVVCVCCMDEEATQKGHAKLDCGHMYCVSCFTQHARLSNKCPLCRDVFAPEPKKERENIPAFVMSEQVQDQLERMLPDIDEAEDVFGFLAVTPSVAYSRLFSLLRNECLSAAISVANWYDPSNAYEFDNTNAADIGEAYEDQIRAQSFNRARALRVQEQQAQEQQAQEQQVHEALENAAENIAAASAGNMESVAMEIDPNPPPGFPARRRLFPDESEPVEQGISSLAQASWRATELVGSADPDLVSSDSTQGNPEQDFIPFDPVEFDAMAALAARDDALPRSSPPEDGEIFEDDTMERYFEQAVSEAESELADAVAAAAEANAGSWQPPTPPRQQAQAENAERRPWRRARDARRQQAQEAAEIASERAAARSEGEDSFTTPLRRQTHDGILYDPDVYFNDD